MKNTCLVYVYDIHMQYLYVFELWLRSPLGQNERTDYKPRVYYLYLF